MSKYIKKYIKYIIVNLIISITFIVLKFITPFLIKRILTLMEFNDTFFVYVIICILSLILLYSLMHINTIVASRFSKNIKVKESKEIYYSMFKVKYSLLKNFDTTYYVTRIESSLNNITDFILTDIPSFIISISTICISLIITIRYSIIITILFILLFVVNVLMYKKLNLKLQNLCVVLQDKYSENFKNIINVCKNIKFIKQSYKYDKFSKKLSNYIGKIVHENNKVTIYASRVSMTLEAIINIIKISIFIFCIGLYFKHKLNLEDIIFIEMILDIYFNALVDFKNSNIGLRDLKASIIFLNESVLSQYEEDNGKKILEKVETIKFDIDKFSYNDEKNILCNVKFPIQKCEKIALVGKSGIGKSTLFNLILRLYKCDSIYINGIDIKNYTLESLRKKIYLINQDINIFSGTIRSNLIIGIEDEYDKNLLKRICNEDFIRDLLNDIGDINTELIDGGGNLSGGQKQKINIARMLMYKPEIIIFDEATSALDAEAENKLFNDIEKYIKDKIIIKISHRFCSICDTQKIVVITDLSNGSEVYSTLEEAKEKSSILKEIFSKQISD